jgi:hypothetical protein
MSFTADAHAKSTAALQSSTSEEVGWAPSSLPPLSRFATSSAMAEFHGANRQAVPFGNPADVAIHEA